MATQLEAPGSSSEQDPRKKRGSAGQADSHEFALPSEATRPNEPYDPNERGNNWIPGPNDLEDAENEPGGFYNPVGDSGSKRASASDLKGSEESGTNAAKSDGDKNEGLYNEGGDNAPGRFKRAREGYRGTRNRLANLRRRALRNKWLVGFGAGGIGALIFLVVALIVISGAYKVVDFAEHIAAYQFARTTSMAALSSTNIDNEATSLWTISDDTLLGQLKSKYTASAGKASDLWSKFQDKYSPNKILSNFNEDGTMKFNYATTKTGRTYIKSVTFDGVKGEFDLGAQDVKAALKNNLIPGYKFASDVKFAREFAPTMTDTLKGADIGVITRAQVASEIRQRLKISLVAWLTAKGVNAYSGLPDKAADAKLARESLGVSEGESLAQMADNGDLPMTEAPNLPQNVPDNVKSADSQVAADQSSGLKTDTGTLQEVSDVNSGNFPGKNAAADVAKLLNPSDLLSVVGLLKTIIKFVNPIYSIATPMCLIWDGSTVNSGPTMSGQSAQIERSGVLVQSAAAQLKDGNTAGGEVDGAWNNKLGDITKTYAERAASGQPIDTSNYQSTEASPTGQYSYTLGDFLGPTVGGFLDTVGSACPALTNLWVAGGISAAALIAQAPEIGSGASALTDTIAQSSMKDVAQLILTKIRNSSESAVNFTGKVVKTGVLVGGATLIARQLVQQEAGTAHSGLATDQQYGNDAFCGTNIYANQINQEQYYGAPLPDNQLPQDNANAQQQFAEENAKASAYQRYFALSNPDSLVSHMAIDTSAYTNSSVFSSVMKLGGALLSPERSLSDLASPFLPKTLAAKPVTSVNTYCGNVQFGYTQQEKNLLNECPATNRSPALCSYQPLENQLVLDNSGKEDAIASYYGKCFDGSEAIGDMLANGDIQRDQSGDIIPDKGLCSPDNLGLHNNDPSGPCGNSGCGDLVFRYRIAHMYNNTMDQLISEQTVDSSSPASTGNGSGASTSPGTLPSGSAQSLAQQLLPYIKQGKISCNGQAPDCPDIQNTATGKSIRGGSCQVDGLQPGLLGTLLELVKMGHSFVLSALCSDHPTSDGLAGHNGGRAADFNYIDGVFMGEGEDGQGTIPWTSQGAIGQKKIQADEKLVQDAASFLPKSAGFGQAQCHPSYTFLAGYNVFPDGCHHQHIQVEG